MLERRKADLSEQRGVSKRDHYEWLKGAMNTKYDSVYLACES